MVFFSSWILFYGPIVIKLHRKILSMCRRAIRFDIINMATIKVKQYFIDAIVMKLHRNYAWDV
jgi:hypothetical protein